MSKLSLASRTTSFLHDINFDFFFSVSLIVVACSSNRWAIKCQPDLVYAVALACGHTTKDFNETMTNFSYISWIAQSRHQYPFFVASSRVDSMWQFHDFMTDKAKKSHRSHIYMTCGQHIFCFRELGAISNRNSCITSFAPRQVHGFNHFIVSNFAVAHKWHSTHR